MQNKDEHLNLNLILNDFSIKDYRLSKNLNKVKLTRDIIHWLFNAILYSIKNIKGCRIPNDTYLTYIGNYSKTRWKIVSNEIPNLNIYFDKNGNINIFRGWEFYNLPKYVEKILCMNGKSKYESPTAREIVLEAWELMKNSMSESEIWSSEYNFFEDDENVEFEFLEQYGIYLDD